MKFVRFVSAGSVLIGICGPALAIQSPMDIAPNWVHESNQENWVPRQVSLGNGGSDVFAHLNVTGLTRRLFRGVGVPGDDGPELFQDLDSDYTSVEAVASSGGGGLHVSAREIDGPEGKAMLVRAFDSGDSSVEESLAERWFYQTPAFGPGGGGQIDLHVAAAGSKVVAICYSGLGDTSVYELDGASGIALNSWVLDTSGAVVASKVSQDGRVLVIESGAYLQALELDTGVVSNRMYLIFGSTESLAVNGDGSLIAFSLVDRVRVWSKNASGFYSSALDIPLGGPLAPRGLVISADGSKLFFAHPLVAGGSDLRLAMVDVVSSLATDSPTYLWERSLLSGSSLMNRVSSTEFSATGHRIAAGFWGDGGGSSAEVLIMDGNSGDVLFSADCPGSVKTLDLSTDGTRLVVASKAEHETTLSGDGMLGFYDLNAPIPATPTPLELGELQVTWTNGPGSALKIRAGGLPNRSTSVFISRTEAEFPRPMNMGTLYLNRNDLVTPPLANTFGWYMGQADDDGQIEMVWDILATEQAPEMHFQCLSNAPAGQPKRLSDEAVRIVIP